MIISMPHEEVRESAEGGSAGPARAGARDDPAARGDRYPLLDVFRGVACLMVVLHHAGFAVACDAPKGSDFDSVLRRAVVEAFWRMNQGVPLFFVISGYCIAASVAAARLRGAGAGRFLARRAWRIYPPYWAALLGFVAVVAGLDALGLQRLHYGTGRHALQLASPGDLDAVQWAGNVTLTEEYRTAFWRTPRPWVYTRVAWSLCYEEQFYFVCSLALLLARRPFRALAVVTALTLAWRLRLEDIGRAWWLGGTFPSLWHEFAVGLAVYWRLNRAASPGARSAVDLALVGLVLLWRNGFLRGTPVEGSSAVAASFGLALIGLRRWDGRSARVGWLAPLRACGRRSYSIYLVHLPVCTVGNLSLHELGLTSFWGMVLVMIPVVSAAAVGAGWLFHGLVERHFLNPPLGPRRGPVVPIRDGG
jgi:peptidoglycan/LPS O-acetylase OafA/YrhL